MKVRLSEYSETCETYAPRDRGGVEEEIISIELDLKDYKFYAPEKRKSTVEQRSEMRIFKKQRKEKSTQN